MACKGSRWGRLWACPITRFDCASTLVQDVYSIGAVLFEVVIDGSSVYLYVLYDGGIILQRVDIGKVGDAFHRHCLQ